MEWTLDDFVRLISEVDNVTIRATMDVCADHPGEWIPSESVRGVTGREPAQHRGDYGGFGITLRTRFKRSNQPFQVKWAAGGTEQQYYTVDAGTAEMWKAAIERAKLDQLPSESLGAEDAGAIQDDSHAKTASAVVHPRATHDGGEADPSNGVT